MARRRSIAELSAEVAANPDSTATVELARAYRERGDLERALRLCLRGLERHPELVSAHLELGLIYWAGGERQLAVDEFGMVKRLAPDDVEARTTLVRLYAAEGRRDDALRELRDALAVKPDDRTLRALRAELADTGEPAGEDGAAGGAGGGATPSGAAAAALAAEAAPSAGARPAPSPAPSVEAAFEGIGPDAEWLGAVVVGGEGRVLLGRITTGGRSVGGELASHLAGAPEEAAGAASYLGLGEWQTLVVESESVRLIVEPVGGHLLIVAARPETPPGRTLRLREAVRRRAEAVGSREG